MACGSGNAPPLRLDGLFDVEQQFPHLFGPCLMVLFFGAGQLAYVMGIAKGMQAVQFEIGLPVVMAKDAGKLGQHIHGGHGFVAPLGMGIIERPLWVRDAM